MKTVVEVQLLPTTWSEDNLQLLHASIVEAMLGYSHIKSEDDFITVFPADVMQKGLGTEINAKINVPDRVCRYTESDFAIAEKVGKAIQQHLPDAYVQCKVYKYWVDEASWDTEQAEQTQVSRR